MAELYFTKILEDGKRKGIIPAKSQAARDYYRNAARNVSSVSENRILKGQPKRLKNKPTVGEMYIMFYDPKHKDTLPYYDRIPVIFPIGPAEGGFYGLNLHYLPPKQRANLMDALYSFQNNEKYDATTKLKISYQILKAASRAKWFKPCVKHYLYQHVRSPYYYVLPDEWDISIFLPIARWEKRTANRVYADSIKKVLGK